MTCRQGDGRWQNPDRLVQPVTDDLVRTAMVGSAADIERVHVERVPFTYPIYKLNYMQELTRNLRELAVFEPAARWPLRSPHTTTWTTRSARA